MKTLQSRKGVASKHDLESVKKQLEIIKKLALSNPEKGRLLRELIKPGMTEKEVERLLGDSCVGGDDDNGKNLLYGDYDAAIDFTKDSRKVYRVSSVHAIFENPPAYKGPIRSRDGEKQ